MAMTPDAARDQATSRDSSIAERLQALGVLRAADPIAAKELTIAIGSDPTESSDMLMAVGAELARTLASVPGYHGVSVDPWDIRDFTDEAFDAFNDWTPDQDRAPSGC
jgi:hypothetical protein